MSNIFFIGNVELKMLPLDQLKTKYLCLDHFDKKYILQKKLAASAVPLVHQYETSIEPDSSRRMYGQQPQEEDELLLPASQEVRFLTPMKRDREEPSTSQIISEA